MFDGLITDGEIIPISGISLAISFLQIFNVEKKITTDCLENIVVSKKWTVVITIKLFKLQFAEFLENIIHKPRDIVLNY